MHKEKPTLIGVAQLDNCVDWKKNCRKAKQVITQFVKQGVHLVCFQEAFLSGYHGSIFKADYAKLSDYLDEIKVHAYQLGVCVLLPTIEKNKNKFYSAAYVFNSDKGDSVCYKQGLTPSELTVMKPKRGKRKFVVNKTSFGILLCREMQDPAYQYIKKEKFPDIILWPSYWGWKYRDKWGPLRLSDGKKDKCHQLINRVKRPLIQINMCTSITTNNNVDKFGKSVVIDSKNKKVGVGKYGKEDLFIVAYQAGKVAKL